MMESAPATAFNVAQSQCLLQLLVFALDDPTMLGHADEVFEPRLRKQRRGPVFRRLCLSARPFYQQPLFRVRFGLPIFPIGWPEAQSGEARAERTLLSRAPSDVFPGGRRKFECQLIHRDRLVSAIAAKQPGWASLAAPWLGRHGLSPRRPNRHCGLNARDIQKVEFGQVRPELTIGPLSGIGQNSSAMHVRFHSPADLLNSDLRLRLEADLFGHSGLVPPFAILHPTLLRQVHLTCGRQAGAPTGHRQTHPHPAVILLPLLPAILPRYSLPNACPWGETQRSPRSTPPPAPVSPWQAAPDRGRGSATLRRSTGHRPQRDAETDTCVLHCPEPDAVRRDLIEQFYYRMTFCNVVVLTFKVV